MKQPLSRKDSCCSMGPRSTRRGNYWGVAACCVLLHVLSPASAADAPNIVVILLDDFSWNATSVLMDPAEPRSKSDFYQTPNLEKLAAQGMRFSNGYSAATACSPTRASLLTGRSPAQLQMTDLPIAAPGSQRWQGHYDNLPLVPPVPEPLSPDVYSLPKIIKDSNPNYTTAHFGKWHLVDGTGVLPPAVGYDVSTDLLPLPPIAVDPYGVFKLANTANAYMEQNVAAGKPFYMQLSHWAPHEPLWFRPEIQDKYEALPPGQIHFNTGYAAIVEDIDTSIGMVMDKIEQLGIADNTYLLFTSDNGAPAYLSWNVPLARAKGEIREGGIRVPYIIQGPGIEPGTVSRVPITTTDIYATVADLVGHQGPLPDNVEGGILTPVLHNGGELPEGMTHISRNFTEGGELYWHWPHNQGPSTYFRVLPSSAVRDGDYKLFVEYGENGAPDKVFLHNLVTDISEATNLAASMPEKTAELRAKLDNYLSAVDASFAYDVKVPATMNWDASQVGNVPNGWRSTIDLKYKGRETWMMGGGSQSPERVASSAFQPGLGNRAFHFDGNDVMRRQFFQVGDDGPRRVSKPATGTGDFDRSASLEFWVKLDSLSNSQILFESGDQNQGLSLTLGNTDADGKNNDLRFRVQGLTGADQGAAGTLKNLTVTVPIDRFANPVADYVHLAAVFSDNPADRYAEIYVNGALAGRVNGLLGTTESLMWDGYDLAGLGNVGGNSLGARSGTGPLPFEGGFRGSIAEARFNNFAIGGTAVLADYNEVLDTPDFGIVSLDGDAAVPAARTSNVSLNATEATGLQIFHERNDTLRRSLTVDGLIVDGDSLMAGQLPDAGSIQAGTRIASYLMQFDPLSNSSTTSHAVGEVQFAGQILAVLWEPASLAATDSTLGSIGNYGTTANRGLDWASAGSLTIAEDLQSLSFNLSVLGDDMLQFRVLTTALDLADFNADGLVNDFDLLTWQQSFGVDAGGDADGDGDTDGRDFLTWQQEYVPIPPPNADLNRDLVVDGADLARWQSSYGTRRGDMDHDGDTDGRDFLLWQREVDLVSADFDNDGLVDEGDLATWQNSFGVNAGGDANGDGVTNGRDFLIWQRSYSQGQQAIALAVPEPATILLAGVLGISAILRRRIA